MTAANLLADPQIDNLVQVAHNVRIGRNCLICGQAGLAGSASLGDFVTLGGRAAVADHVSVCSKARGSIVEIQAARCSECPLRRHSLTGGASGIRCRCG